MRERVRERWRTMSAAVALSADDDFTLDEAGDLEYDPQYQEALSALRAREADASCRLQLLNVARSNEAVAELKGVARTTFGCQQLVRALDVGAIESFLFNIINARRVKTAEETEREAVRASVDARLGKVFGANHQWWK